MVVILAGLGAAAQVEENNGASLDAVSAKSLSDSSPTLGERRRVSQCEGVVVIRHYDGIDILRYPLSVFAFGYLSVLTKPPTVFIVYTHFSILGRSKPIIYSLHLLLFFSPLLPLLLLLYSPLLNTFQVV
ncbi:hypothetical protein GGI42DRAFT_319051 [Trichoderma sp. SZMC 28013]